jgi:hypothetical protein
MTDRLRCLKHVQDNLRTRIILQTQRQLKKCQNVTQIKSGDSCAMQQRLNAEASADRFPSAFNSSS